jgi:hypothetical protein
MIRKLRLRNLLKEIWFGSSYYRSALGILNIGSGPLIGRTTSDHSMCVRQFIYLGDIGRRKFARALNGKYLKKYYPSIWVDG